MKLLFRDKLDLVVLAATIPVVVLAVFGIEWRLDCSLVPGLLTFAVYQINRLTDLREDEAIRPSEVTCLSPQTVIRIKLFSFVAALGALTLAFGDGAAPAAIIVSSMVVGCAYSLRFIPARFGKWVGFRRFKEVLIVKNILPAATWAGIMVAFPVLASGASYQASLVAATLFVFLLTLTIEILWDWRDVEGDRLAGISTIPNKFGVTVTRRVCLTILGVSVCAVFACWGLKICPAKSLVGLLQSVYLVMFTLIYCRDNRELQVSSHYLIVGLVLVSWFGWTIVALV